MLKVRALVSCLVLALAPVVVLAAGARPLERPQRFLPGSLDAGLVQVTSDDGLSVISAWAYRSGAEYDIAISLRGSDGNWTSPQFIGQDDGRNQVQPALALTAEGTALLAYADAASGSIMFSCLDEGAATWSRPRPVSQSEVRAASPALRIVGDRLVLGYRVGRDVRLIELSATCDEGGNGSLINDGPDPVSSRPGGDGKDSGDDDREERPTPTSFRTNPAPFLEARPTTGSDDG